jgi:drug/metabolite transporter (DMT)-like permease
MWRKGSAMVLTGVLSLVPQVALAFGGPVEEPNIRFWMYATVVALLLAGPAVATLLYWWWMRRMRAGTARIWAVVTMLLVPALASLFAYTMFMGPLPDLLVYGATGVTVLVILIASFVPRRHFV